MKQEVEICDNCKKNLAEGHCFFCGCALCSNCDFGGKYSFISINVTVYNNNLVEALDEIRNIIHICHNCTDKFKEKPYTPKKELIEAVQKDFEEYLQTLKEGK